MHIARMKIQNFIYQNSDGVWVWEMYDTTCAGHETRELAIEDVLKHARRRIEELECQLNQAKETISSVENFVANYRQCRGD